MELENLKAEVFRLKSELRANKMAYNKLQKEKDKLEKDLGKAHEQIKKLYGDLEMKEKLFSEYREAKEKDYDELLKIKSDLQVRLQSALEIDDNGLSNANIPTRLNLSLNRSQSWWSHSSGPQLTCTEAVESLKKWEGVEGTVLLFNDLLKEEQGKVHWKPGTPWTCKWKPHLRIYISGSLHNQLYNAVLPELETFCRAGGCSLSMVNVSLNDAERIGLNGDLMLELCLKDVSKCDIFLCILEADSDTYHTITKLEVEHGFLNNPTARPSIFVFLDSKSGSSSEVIKLKQRVKKISDKTQIIEDNSFNETVEIQLVNEVKRILTNNYDVVESNGNDQDVMFDHLSLLSDMRVEYEQLNLMNTVLSNSPNKPTGIDVTFDSLIAYMREDSTSVAPYLITAKPGAGKSTLLAKWSQYIKEEYVDEVIVMHHFVSRACSSSSETCLMYRRFIFKLIHLCAEGGSTVTTDPNKLEECFVQLLDVTSARLQSLGYCLLFILIDNAELLLETDSFGWILKPLPQNVRVVLTANELSSYPDSWRALPTCTLPSPTATDFQEVISGVNYGSRQRILTEDQSTALAVSTPSNSSQLWCVMAAKFVLSCSTGMKESEIEEMIESLEQLEDIAELAKVMIDDMNARCSLLIPHLDKILQLIYWSRNGLSLFELNKILQVPCVVLLHLVSELERRHIIWEIAGLLQFTNESVQELVLIRYDVESTSEHILNWTQPLLTLFSDLSNLPLARCASELPWLLKRADLHQELLNVLLNVDILIQLYCSGEGALLLRLWRTIGVNFSDIADEYYKELSTMEEQASTDQSCLLYIAMVLYTVGKILHNLGLGIESQPLLQHSLELYECNSDPDSSEVATVMFELANLYSDLERYSAAESFYKQAIEVYEHTQGEDSDQALKVLSSLSTLYEYMKRPDLLDTVTTRLYSLREQRNLSKPNALTLLKRRADELENLLTSFEENHIPTQSDILALNEWSLIHASFGDKSIAEEYLFTALQSSEHVLGEHHSVTLLLLKNLTTLYIQMNKFDDAIALQQHVVELKEKEMGPQHTSVAAAINNLAVFYCFKKDYYSAVPYYDRAIEIYKEHYGSDHSLVQDTITNRQLAADNLRP